MIGTARSHGRSRPQNRQTLLRLSSASMRGQGWLKVMKIDGPIRRMTSFASLFSGSLKTVISHLTLEFGSGQIVLRMNARSGCPGPNVRITAVWHDIPKSQNHLLCGGDDREHAQARHRVLPRVHARGCICLPARRHDCAAGEGGKGVRRAGAAGRLGVTYSGPEAGKEPGLAVECDLFRASVPARGLADLPRPDWECFFAAYSLTSYDSGKLTERPYVYVQVPLSGPAGKPWQQTWATFDFDADGKLIRRIKRFISSEATKGIRVVWKEWEIGSGVSADDSRISE